MASSRSVPPFRGIRLAAAVVLGLAMLPAAAHARQMDMLLAQLITDAEPAQAAGSRTSPAAAEMRGAQTRGADARGAATETRGAEAAAHPGTACAEAGPGGELVIRPQPGCSMAATANVVRLAAAALDVPRQTPECRRIGHCRPSRSFTRLHSLASLSYERGRLGGPRYWGQKY